MTLETTVTDVEGLGNGAATVFSLAPLKLYSSTDLAVVLVTIATGVEVVIPKGTGASSYSLQIAKFPGTGTITYPADEVTPMASTHKVLAKLVLPLTQLTKFRNQGGYSPENLEAALDRILYIEQQQQEEINRAIKAPLASSSLFDGTLPPLVAGEFLKVKADKLGLETSSLTSTASASSATPQNVSLSAGAAGTSGDFSRADHVHDIGVSSDMESFLGAATDAAARTALAVFEEKKGSDVASASPLVVPTDGSSYFDITGTTSFAAFTVAANKLFMAQFDGILTLTHGSAIVLPGGANITTAAGDVLVGFSTAANVVVVLSYTKADGTAVVAATQTGHVVQRVNITKTALDTSTTSIALDDTIPPNTEGKETMTLAITPKSTTNKLLIEVVLQLSSATARHCIAALFQDTTSAALGVGFSFVDTAGGATVITFTHEMAAGTVSATTFKVRYGNDDGSSLYLNGVGGARRFGGVCNSSITITEIQA